MMKTALIAKLCFQTNGGPTYFSDMLELTSINKNDWHLIEEAITDEMLQDFDFVEWLTEKIKQWQIKSFDVDLWKDHIAYFPRNGQYLLHQIYRMPPPVTDEFSTRKTNLPPQPAFQFAVGERIQTNKWNEYLLEFGTTSLDETYLPNRMQSTIENIQDIIQTNANHAIPFLTSYLILSANRLGIAHVMRLLDKFFFWNANLFQVLEFFYFWNENSVEYILFRDVVIQSLDSIYQQIFFSSRNCWWDTEKQCEICKEENWQHFLPQYRCIALCSEKVQCMRFAKPYSDFCLYHTETTVKQIKKRICKDPCPTSNKSLPYHQNPYQSASFLALYPKTARLVSELSQYNPRNDWIENEWYLPCIRYDSIYYSGHSQEDDKKYCGKFFYYEPQSSTAIRLGKSLFCATKVHAWLRLQFLVNGPSKKSTFLKHMLQNGKYSDDIFQFAPNLGNNNFNVFETMKGILDMSCNLYTKQYFDIWLTFHYCTLFLSLEETFDCVDDICIPLFFPSIKPDIRMQESFVGAFDFLDQPICFLARKLGLDTVVFQHEVGSNDCVTEIMHVSPNFAKDLYQIQEPILTNVKGQSILPKIWFPKNDGVVTFRNHHIHNVPLDDPPSIFQHYESNVPRKQKNSGYMRDAVHEFQPRIPKRREILYHVHEM